MNIAKVRIQGFRCLEDVEVAFDDITTFVGPNGAGKSSILRALDWFFNGGVLSEDDVYSGAEVKKIVVRVDFDHLTEADREKLEKYGKGTDTFTAWKIWDNGAEKITGKALAFEPFERVRTAGSATNKKKVHGEILQENPGLGIPPWTTSEAITMTALDAWESTHPELLTEAQISSTNFFGFNSQGKLSGLFDYVFVTADLRASEESQDTKLTVIGRILEKTVNRTAANEALKTLSEDLRKRHAEINTEHFATQLADLSEALSKEVRALTAGRDVKVQAVDAAYKPQPAKFQVRIGDGDTETSVERQGHGFQRSLLIAALKLLAERGSAENDGSVICLAIEEPELFQHPSKARAFARVLRKLAETVGSGIQVTYATHSPQFIEPHNFHQIRRVSRMLGTDGGHFAVRVDHASIDEVITRLAGYVDACRVKNQVDGVCTNRLGSALFAAAVLLVEGGTDKSIFDGISERNAPLGVDSIVVAEAGNKMNVLLAFAILEQLGIPTQVVIDSDSAWVQGVSASPRL